MTFDPAIHHRRSIRLSGYNYSRCGAYFVTVCTQKNDAVAALSVADIPAVAPGSTKRFALSKIGEIVEKNWLDLCSRFSQVSLDEYMIMPNHFHGILFIHDMNRATARVAPTLGEIIGAFKSKFVTDILSYIAANKLDMRGKIWQRNYYERIIRNAKELNAIRAYIRNNPQNWNKDRER